ncbi:uncharacterized protein ARMOST_18224 [Armillaria ostoyae]|uniref:Uncharacterized protein n=1 Tax=Armillaria ostoyae TaxID=47428 RepID=A0A284S1B2_ARMOS|nr:uncharacterized protein ARMOST_18224 [Armillaria ostoyae]
MGALIVERLEEAMIQFGQWSVLASMEMVVLYTWSEYLKNCDVTADQRRYWVCLVTPRDLDPSCWRRRRRILNLDVVGGPFMVT